MVGGIVEEDETLEKAVVREVKEELGLEFVPELFLEEMDNKSVVNETWEVYFYKGLAKGELKLKTDEVLEIAYVGENDLDEFDIAYDHRERLEEFFEK